MERDIFAILIKLSLTARVKGCSTVSIQFRLAYHHTLSEVIRSQNCHENIMLKHFLSYLVFQIVICIHTHTYVCRAHFFPCRCCNLTNRKQMEQIIIQTLTDVHIQHLQYLTQSRFSNLESLRDSQISI